MQCLRIWFTIWLFAISVNIAVASPVDILNVDNKTVSDLNTAGSDQEEAVISERDNEVGYLRRADEKGADAYQHFESFHDKDGDAYGYEKHEAYGKSNKGESLNDGKDKSEGSHYNYVQELGDKPKYQKYQGSNDDPSKQQNNYHYSYNSEDDNDDDKKPNYSSNYKLKAHADDSSEEEEEDTDSNGTDEEKTTNFRYKIVSDDDDENDSHGDENDSHGDVNSKGNGNGYHFGHGDKNTNVDYNVKTKSDYTAGDDDDADDDDDDEDDDEGEGKDENDDEDHEEENGENVTVKDKKINEDQGKAKNTKSYSTYTTYSSDEGDDLEEDKTKKNTEIDFKPIPKHIVRYENTSPVKNTKHSSKQQKIIVEHDSEEDSENDDGDDGQVNEDVELHQAAQPRPTKPVELVKEHRTQYQIENDHPEPIPTKPKVKEVIIVPSNPIVVVHEEHHAGYKVEESDGGKGSDDSGKSNGGGGGDGGGDSKGSDDDGGDDGKGKSENLVLEQPQKLKAKTDDGNDNGAYKVNINYGNKKGPNKNVGKRYRKRKGSLKKKKIIKPHKYEVEEYTDSRQETKQPTVATKKALPQQHKQSTVAGKESSPQHHKDSEDYSNGQQFIFASEADSDAYYW